ncbi:conserved hypothetical protein [Leifsonia xyli subsp. xyli str. CTCB07]|uniref:Pyridoxamine 5-phosphate oxidase n=1 Tax=Leifsonia xyli subsp. xyli (strain CTCB07) TaxID=281090 RepID=Q6ACG4_LEIXX|nr:conserved hypothetical protein [Leifsonia xyli subsp. xyli str. CTCB07]
MPAHPRRPGEDEFYSAQGPATILSPESCWAYLRLAAGPGRLGIVIDNDVHIIPVDYVVDGPSIALRTADGRKLEAFRAGGLVAFEIDHHDDRESWSVLARGRPRVVTDARDVRRLDDIAWPRWIPVSVYSYVEIAVDQISGRRISSEIEVARLTDDATS